ncbi:hypothetical protein HDK77DRAFT_486522 [Phyllosticta capitalensis]
MVTLSHRPTAASLCCKTSSPPVSRGWVAVPYIVIAAVVFFAVVATTAAFRHHGTWPVVLGVLPRRRFSADRPPASSLLLVPSPLPLPSPSPSLGITSDGSNPTDTGSKKDLFTSIRVIKLIVTGCVYVAHPDAQELLLSMEPKLTAIESDMIKANTGMRRRFLAQQATQHADTDLFLRDTQWPETLRGLTLVDVALMACLNHDDDPAFMTALRYLRRDALS